VDITTLTWSPKAVGSSDSVQLATLQKGQLVLEAWLWVDLPSDSGSSGQVGLSGDTFSLFALSSTVSSDLYSDQLGRAIFFLNNQHSQVATAAQTVTLTWTPGGSPGATAPRFIVRLITEQLF
jgi:hypothetical protein